MPRQTLSRLAIRIEELALRIIIWLYAVNTYYLFLLITLVCKLIPVFSWIYTDELAWSSFELLQKPFSNTILQDKCALSRQSYLINFRLIIFVQNQRLSHEISASQTFTM